MSKAALWLQLGGAPSAAATLAILALPMRYSELLRSGSL
jgi:hypothetical protein